VGGEVTGDECVPGFWFCRDGREGGKEERRAEVMWEDVTYDMWWYSERERKRVGVEGVRAEG